MNIQFALTVFLALGFLPISFGISGERGFSQGTSEQSATPIIEIPGLKVEKVVDGLSLPTGMAFLGPNDILVVEKNNGTVQRVVNGSISEEPLLDLNVANLAESGLLGITIARNDSQNQINGNTSNATYIFLYYTASGLDVDDYSKGIGNRLYRYELVDGQLVNPVLFLEIPSGPGGVHNGGAMLTAPDNSSVYLVVGNVNSSRTTAQNFRDGPEPDGTSGILKIEVNSNQSQGPILGTGGLLQYYYAYGIRNGFGIAIDPVTGQLWDTENGPNYGDEVNLVLPGFNSGFREILGMASADADMSRLVDFDGKGNYSDPEFVWNSTVGPTSLVFLNTDKLGSTYENNLIVGDIEHGNLYHFELNETRDGFILNGSLADRIAQDKEELEDIIVGTGFLGITDIEVGPDGYLYVLSFGDGAIYRIMPTENGSSVSEDDNNGAFDGTFRYRDLLE
jgi:aldose sugar dehydrogenase